MIDEQFKQRAAQQKKRFSWVTPVLPLAGAKSRRWWREIQTVAETLPKNSKVFDSFAGTFCVSRIIKDIRPDVQVTVNDYELQYTTRLNAIYQTVSLWETLHRGIAYNDEKQSKFLRFTEEQENIFRSCMEQAIDKTTVSSWGNGYGSLRNKVPKSPPDLRLSKTWTNGLEIVNMRMSRSTDMLINLYDFFIMDPPYTNTNCRKHYSDATKDAREWCMEVINSGKPYVLWDLASSDLMYAARSAGAEIIDEKVMGYTGKDTGKEAMALRYKCSDSESSSS